MGKYIQISKNKPCPCGSGKLYKRCCLLKTSSNKGADKNKKGVKSVWQKYNSFDLMQLIAGLTLLPENHGKNVRLELIALEILKNYNNNKDFAELSTIKSTLDSQYLSHHLEDPVVNQFTDLITFYGGDYLIFPGITDGGSFMLSNLLNAVFLWPAPKMPHEFISNFQHATFLLLSISNAIAQKLGYNRYMDGTLNEQVISFADSKTLQHTKNSVAFSEHEMSQLLSERSIAPEAIDAFTFDINSIDIAQLHPVESPLIYRPIIQESGRFLIASPATLSFALTRFIINEARRWGCYNRLSEAYKTLLWNTIQFQLGKMKFRRLDLSEILAETQLPGYHGLYQFDDDKIAYVQLIHPVKNVDTKEQTTGAEKQKAKIISRILTVSKYKDFKFLDIVILSTLEEQLFFPFGKTENAKSIVIPVFEFDVMSNLGDIDAVDLWKFATAREEQLSHTPFVTHSLLDQFKVYREHDDSFYLSDETKYTSFNVEPGYASQLVRAAKLKSDSHSALIETDRGISSACVQMKDKYAPVYLNINDIASGELRFLVEGFSQSVWVEPKLIPDGISHELKHMLWEVNDAIAYWLWQLQPFIKEDLEVLGVNPITITFELNPPAKFEIIDQNFERDKSLSDKFVTTATKTHLNISIPHEIQAFLYGSDNEGERILVHHLLLGINKLLSAKGHSEISIERIQKIIDECAPLGMKKKIFILDTNDNLLLDPRNIPEDRYIQDYDESVVLDSILPGLESPAPPVGEITSKAEKEKLTRAIVLKSLLPKLQKAISQYDAQTLLERLIGLNESLINKRENLKIQTPTRIACFVSVEQQEHDLMESLEKLNRTIIANRCLIEHIAAEQCRGSKIISTTAIDELIAIMDQIIAWGSLGDQITHDLFDIKMGILASGRIGTSKDVVNEVFDPYHQSKTKESVADAIKFYDQVFPKRNPTKGMETPENLDKAFLTDFGVSFNRICEFIEGLTIIGIQQNTPFAVSDKKSLRDAINKVVKPFSDGEFESVIQYLSLFKRDDVKDVPPGYDHFDISPWRFNRRLSLNRKPLVIFENLKDKNNPLIYWGFRQVLSSRLYLADQILSNRLKVDPNGSLISVLGKLVQEQGTALVKKVVQKLKQENFIIDSNVEIGPNRQLYDSADLGDIDVLLIDLEAKIIFSLECKNMAPSRNIKEMIEEVSKLFGSDSEKGWIKKHIQRHDWVEKNKAALGKKYSIDLSQFKVKSLFITEEDMLTPYLKKQSLPMPFVTRYELEEHGVKILREK